MNDPWSSKLGRVFAWFFLIGFFGWICLSPQRARAGAGDFLETIGISTTIGMVLGASTLPFYDQPGKHLVNIAYGASVGAVVGLGVWIYGLGQGDNDPRVSSSGEVEDGKGFYKQEKLRNYDRRKVRLEPPPKSTSEIDSRYTVPTPQVWMPLVSLNW